MNIRVPIALCLLSTTVLAHGGAYRGPTVSSGRGITPGNPGPAVGSPGRGGPITPNAAFTPDVTRWQVWWELNKDPYLRAPKLALDPKRPEAARKAITDRQKIAEILPALKKALDSSTNQHIVSACMISLGKIGLDHPDFKILDVFRQRLRRGNQEIREVAALAMGISKKPEAIDDLAALLGNTFRGRRLMNKEKVDDRTRAFAAYGLGLIARGNEDVGVKSRVYESLKRVLEDRNQQDRDILIATLNGMRLLDPRPARGGKHRRLLWASLETLEKYQARRLGKSREAIQAHAPTAIARILGRGTGPDHRRAKQYYTRLFGSSTKRHSALYQSTAIAMGRLLLAPENHAPEAEHVTALWRHYDKSRDQLSRYFTLIAAGQIGGDRNYEELVKVFKSGKRDVKAWSALALGLMAFHAPKPPVVKGAQGPAKDLRARIGPFLHRHLLRINNRDVRAAIAIGLGLCGHLKSAPDMRKLVKKYRKVEEFAGYLCMGLALMDDKASGALIQDVMSDASRRPLLMAQSALALARLQHPGASVALRSVLRSGGQFRTLTLASASNAMGYLADPGNVDPLVRILGRSGNNHLVRAFSAVALGSMAENDPLTWSAWIAMNMNYSATVETLSNGSAGILDIL